MISTIHKDLRKSILASKTRKKDRKSAWIIDGKLTVITFGSSSAADDVRIYKDLHYSMVKNVGRVFNAKRFYISSSKQRAKYSIHRFLSDAEYRKSFENGNPMEACC